MQTLINCNQFTANFVFILLVNEITVPHSHPSFDEADDAFIQERQRCLLHQDLGVAQLSVHLLWEKQAQNKMLTIFTVKLVHVLLDTSRNNTTFS